MAKKVNTLMNNNVLRLRIGRNALVSAAEFTQAKVGEKWYAMLENL